MKESDRRQLRIRGDITSDMGEDQTKMALRWRKLGQIPRSAEADCQALIERKNSSEVRAGRERKHS